MLHEIIYSRIGTLGMWWVSFALSAGFSLGRNNVVVIEIRVVFDNLTVAVGLGVARGWQRWACEVADGVFLGITFQAACDVALGVRLVAIRRS